MRYETFYTAGDFAKKAGVTIRTIRFYDSKGLLKPSSISDSGYRLYTDADFAKLQIILEEIINYPLIFEINGLCTQIGVN